MWWIMQVACGGEHTMMICPEGRVYTWGRGNMGQTGLGSTETVNVPTMVKGLLGKHIMQVSAVRYLLGEAAKTHTMPCIAADMPAHEQPRGCQHDLV